MRPLTIAVFKRESQNMIGSPWTEDQVRQAYEKADDLLDYIAKYKTLKDIQKEGLDQLHPYFASGLKDRVAQNLPDKSVQALSLDILGHLLEAGRETLRFAACCYRHAPMTFQKRYASSKPAFFKDKFLLRELPIDSFSPFTTGDNPAITQNKKLSQICASLYNASGCEALAQSHPLNYDRWLRSSAGDKFSRETAWLQKIACTTSNRLKSSLPAIPRALPQLERAV